MAYFCAGANAVFVELVAGAGHARQFRGWHLIEGLKNPTLITNESARGLFPIHPMGMREAIHEALRGTTS